MRSPLAHNNSGGLNRAAQAAQLRGPPRHRPGFIRRGWPARRELYIGDSQRVRRLRDATPSVGRTLRTPTSTSQRPSRFMKVLPSILTPQMVYAINRPIFALPDNVHAGLRRQTVLDIPPRFGTHAGKHDRSTHWPPWCRPWREQLAADDPLRGEDSSSR